MSNENSPNKIEPIDFLQFISEKPLLGHTITEEIFEEEKKEFCVRMKHKLYSPKNLSPLIELSKQFSISPNLERKLKNYNGKGEDSLRKSSLIRIGLPKIKQSQIRFHSPKADEFKFGKRKFSIDKIVKTYEEGVERSLTTKNFKSLVVRNSIIAREYAKDMMKASDILHEIDGFQSNIKRKLYLELKSSKDGYESEKIQLIKDFTKKLVLNKSYKSKKLKNLVRNKVHTNSFM